MANIPNPPNLPEKRTGKSSQLQAKIEMFGAAQKNIEQEKSQTINLNNKITENKSNEVKKEPEKKSIGAKQTYIATGAKNLYNMYKKKVEQAQAENKHMEYIKDPKSDRVLDVVKDRQEIIHYFTISGDAAGAAQMVVQGFAKEQQSRLTVKAITDANKAACKEENIPYKEQTVPVIEKEKAVNKVSQAAVMA